MTVSDKDISAALKSLHLRADQVQETELRLIRAGADKLKSINRALIDEIDAAIEVYHRDRDILETRLRSASQLIARNCIEEHQLTTRLQDAHTRPSTGRSQSEPPPLPTELPRASTRKQAVEPDYSEYGSQEALRSIEAALKS